MIKLKFTTMSELIDFCNNTTYSKGRHSECLYDFLCANEYQLTNEQFNYVCSMINVYAAKENQPHRVGDNGLTQYPIY